MEQTEGWEEKAQMRIFIHGTDKGNAVLTALILIIILSTIFMSLIPRIITTKRFALEYKVQVIRNIEQSNEEILNLYDFY